MLASTRQPTSCGRNHAPSTVTIILGDPGKIGALEVQGRQIAAIAVWRIHRAASVLVNVKKLGKQPPFVTRKRDLRSGGRGARSSRARQGHCCASLPAMNGAKLAPSRPAAVLICRRNAIVRMID